ncbi:MAG: phospho-sugar mutase [Bacteroidota bacterium]|nr:phospho-sugar mutase [Bacteroidota bacterium]
MQNDTNSLLYQSRKEAEKWLTYPIHSVDKKKIKVLLNKKNQEELIESFHKKLEFGTGGMRGKIGIGTNRINIYTIGFATQGLSNYLKQKFENNISVAIAYDSRKFSKDFATQSAIIFSSNNIKSYIFPELRPTPELSFAVRKLNCNCGIVITASHNPKEYNGYKVYWEDGGQITYPHDNKIIYEVNKLNNIDDINTDKNQDLIKIISKEIDRSYLNKIKNLSMINNKESNLKIVYTPLHGTGITQVPNALRVFGFKNFTITKSQESPNPNFPTVTSPNPEDENALSEGIKDLIKTKSDILLATDPDADRVGVVIRKNNRCITLNGNQLASIIIYYTLLKKKEKNTLYNNSFVAKTIVTSHLIEKICNEFNVKCYSTLTGFKYIAQLIREKPNEKFIAGCEESYGYLVDDFVRDKDAVISSAIICEIANWCKNKNEDLTDFLNFIYKKYGFYFEKLHTIKLDGVKGKKKINKIMSEFRNNPPKYIFNDKTSKIIDYNKIETNSIIKSKSNVLQFITKNNHRLTIRPSGTEPKIKFYFSLSDKNQNNEKKLSLLAEKEINEIENKYA